MAARKAGKAPEAKAPETKAPPAAVAKQAARGLELREKFGRGGTEVGLKRARDLEARKPVDAATMKKMRSYFARHKVDKRGKNWGDHDKPSAGYIAWLLWGGEEGKAWVEGALAEAEA
jgi:hypothetical protein